MAMHLTPTIKEESFQSSEVLLKLWFRGLGSEISSGPEGDEGLEDALYLLPVQRGSRGLLHP